MVLYFDTDGYVCGYDDGVGSRYGVEGVPFDGAVPDGFRECFSCYRFVDGALVFDEGRADARHRLQLKEDICARREVECFPVINRGLPWYAQLTPERYAEVMAWYSAWLEAPDTLVVPDRPGWLDEPVQVSQEHQEMYYQRYVMGLETAADEGTAFEKGAREDGKE